MTITVTITSMIVFNIFHPNTSIDIIENNHPFNHSKPIIVKFNYDTSLKDVYDKITDKYCKQLKNNYYNSFYDFKLYAYDDNKKTIFILNKRLFKNQCK